MHSALPSPRAVLLFIICFSAITSLAYAAAPTVTSITPDSGLNLTIVSITNLAGTGFTGTPTVSLTKSGAGNITATNVNVVDPTKITCLFNLTGTTSIGLWNVTVINPNGEEGSKVGAFTIQDGRAELLLSEETYDNLTADSRYYHTCKDLINWDKLGLPDKLNGQWYYTYKNMMQAINDDPRFAKEGNNNTRKLEIAAFLANVAQETGMGDQFLYGGPGCVIQEGRGAYWKSNVFGGNNTINGAGFGGRGPHQLTYDTNYLAYGQAMGVGNLYLNNPDLLTTDPITGIKGSTWFWGRAEPPSEWTKSYWPRSIAFKPAAHDIVIGNWTPTDNDIKCNRQVANFGIIINLINGGIECGLGPKVQATNRVNYLNQIANIMNVTIPAGFAVDCADQQNFAACPRIPVPEPPSPASGSDEPNSGDSNPETSIAAASPAHQTVTFTFANPPITDKVSVHKVSFKHNDPVQESQCIVEDNIPSPEFAYSGGPALYMSITMNWVNPSAISSGTIQFSVLKSWLKENNIDPVNVVLMRQHDLVWSELPTTFDHQTGDLYYYTAVTPGFSYFAVTEKKALPAHTTVPKVTVISAVEAEQVSTVNDFIAITTIPTMTAPAKTETPVPAIPAPEPSTGIPAVYWIAILGIIILAVAGFFFGRRWYWRRQNPKLFGKE